MRMTTHNTVPNATRIPPFTLHSMHQNLLYSINIKVVDDIDSAAFMLYDKEASKFLGISASDLRLAQLTRGGTNEEYPTELNSFRGKRFLFKVSVKMEDLNSFQPCKIIVMKLYGDIFQLNLCNLHDSAKSGIRELRTTQHATPKDTCSPSVEILVGDTNKGYSTLKRNIVGGGWTKQLIDLYPDSTEGSSTKCRKLKMAKLLQNTIQPE
ncbi:hypothetical protein Ahy_A10g049857 [Arachis hypogaea]|uniref:Replication factor A C-terminal domain-containing protein n=1 Tax=Arachis hypogaea TaxID=3818 RepID=A0A445B812_ARAHY|nr:hypothetical protein Ahy_A10g049857 [Arachis hypogaea]